MNSGEQTLSIRLCDVKPEHTPILDREMARLEKLHGHSRNFHDAKPTEELQCLSGQGRPSGDVLAAKPHFSVYRIPAWSGPDPRFLEGEAWQLTPQCSPMSLKKNLLVRRASTCIRRSSRVVSLAPRATGRNWLVQRQCASGRSGRRDLSRTMEQGTAESQSEITRRLCNWTLHFSAKQRAA